MKKNTVGFGIIAIFAVIGLVSCNGMPTPQQPVQQAEVAGMYWITGDGTRTFAIMANLPTKDFEPVQLVFTDNVLDPSMAGGGEIFTFHQLLMEARGAGAHGIMNVHIERVETTRLVDGTVELVDIRFLGTALAIRYTATIVDRVEEIRLLPDGDGVRGEVVVFYDVALADAGAIAPPAPGVGIVAPAPAETAAPPPTAAAEPVRRRGWLWGVVGGIALLTIIIAASGGN